MSLRSKRISHTHMHMQTLTTSLLLLLLLLHLHRRNYHFGLTQDDVKNWHKDGHFVSLFFNALSMFFPAGETMFIKAVQAHRKQTMNDPVLMKQVAGFVQQEAIHGREHQIYNDAIRAAYPCVVYAERGAEQLCHIVLTYFPIRAQLAATVALEHWTGILAGALLSNEDNFNGNNKNFGAIWHWHALEETEHKAVAYDVYINAYGYGIVSWMDRMKSLFLTSVLLWTMAWFSFLLMVVSEGSLFDVQEWGKLLWNHWGYPGQLRLCILPFFDFFKPNFHPWQHDNREVLANMAEVEEDMKDYLLYDKKQKQ